MGSSTISAKTLAGAVDKARGLGLYEERFSLSDDCEVVLRNLRPDEYELALNDCKGLEGMEYLYTFQKAHVSRALCEVNGQSLRDVKFVEVDEPDPKDINKIKTVKLELHSYVRKYLVDTWSKEILYVAYRKFGDAVAEAERRSKEGIKFIVSEETQEERFRRLLGEIKDTEGDLPPELVERTLVEFGFMHHTTAEQAKNIDDQLASVAPVPVAPTPQAPAPVAADPAPEEVAPEQTPKVDPAALAADPVKLMRTRVPLNRQAEPAPVPVPRWAPQAPAPQAQAPVQQAPVARQQPYVQAPAVLNTPQAGGGPVALSRSARIAALEAEGDPGVANLLAGSSMDRQQAPQEIPVLTGRSNDRPDPAAVLPTIDPAPPAGLNPLYRPPPR
jgi:hypothetical protein